MKILVCVLCAVAVPLTFTTSTCLAQSGQPLSAVQLPGFHVEQFSTSAALWDISQKTKIPIGFQSLVDFKTERSFSFNFPGGTVAALFDSFISDDPGYQWKVSGAGVVHLFRASTSVSLTDVILAYPGAQNKTRKEISTELVSLAEVKAWMVSNGCSRQEIFSGKEFRANNGPISIAAGNISVSELLDQVVLKSGSNYWSVVETRANGACQVSIVM